MLSSMNAIKWASENVPEPILFFIRPIYRIYKRVADVFLSALDSLKIVGPDFIYSEDYYSKRQDDPWRSDAQQVGSVIKQYFEPGSVIDFGCAIGAHLEPFYNDGVDIKGVEGNSNAFDYAVVPTKHLEQYDLRNKYDAEKEYDLVLSFELAEHLPERYADNLVDTLANAGDTIVMTAATPGQGGTHHVNEQPREYWYEKFQSRGFEYDSEAVQDLRSMIDVEESTWIPDNIMVFVASDSTT